MCMFSHKHRLRNLKEIRVRSRHPLRSLRVVQQYVEDLTLVLSLSFSSVIPIMTLHLKRSFPPVVLCHVTGLSTSTVEMSWERNEKEVDDYVMIGKTLPSGDGKFQKTIYLFAESEDLMKNEYRCVLTFKTLKGKTTASMNQQLHLIYGTE